MAIASPSVPTFFASFCCTGPSALASSSDRHPSSAIDPTGHVGVGSLSHRVSTHRSRPTPEGMCPQTTGISSTSSSMGSRRSGVRGRRCL
ncbi:hypothetical protein CK203_072272 [Vitis vinifera]|uniref:Uncharacterized protein n=1 Tax=Vitis vinifera TaxID=29760 RepID=A0A438BVG5_VITVI|nr:hypothetical protein CK203_072272 [Vitis vinifera]